MKVLYRKLYLLNGFVRKCLQVWRKVKIADLLISMATVAAKYRNRTLNLVTTSMRSTSVFS